MIFQFILGFDWFDWTPYQLEPGNIAQSNQKTSSPDAILKPEMRKNLFAAVTLPWTSQESL